MLTIMQVIDKVSPDGRFVRTIRNIPSGLLEKLLQPHVCEGVVIPMERRTATVFYLPSDANERTMRIVYHHDDNENHCFHPKIFDFQLFLRPFNTNQALFELFSYWRSISLSSPTSQSRFHYQKRSDRDAVSFLCGWQWQEL